MTDTNCKQKYCYSRKPTLKMDKKWKNTPQVMVSISIPADLKNEWENFTSTLERKCGKPCVQSNEVTVVEFVNESAEIKKNILSSNVSRYQWIL